jgi:dipeptidyl aminopeptidase/acylaminoacyl peptidase
MTHDGKQFDRKFMYLAGQGENSMNSISGRVALGLALLALGGCVALDANSATPVSLGGFPADLVAEVSLPKRPPASQEQLAFCFFDPQQNIFHEHAEIRILALDGSAVSTISPSPSLGPDVSFGCIPFETEEGQRELSPVDYSWSPDGKNVLLVASGSLYLADLTSDAQPIGVRFFLQLPQYISYGDNYFPTWSPDGQRVAFIGSNQDLKAGAPWPTDSIFITSWKGDNIRQMTFEYGLFSNANSLIWSHDGRYLAHILPTSWGSKSPLPFGNGLGIVDTSNDSLIKFEGPQLDPSLPAAYGPYQRAFDTNGVAWLPGDALILFVVQGNTPEQNQLWVIRPDGSDSRALYTGDIRWLALSPDGKRLVVIVVEQGAYTLKLLRLESELKVETLLDAGHWPLATQPGAVIRDAEWSPDGTRLAFASNPQGNYDLFLWDSLTGQITPLTQTPAFEVGPHWRPYTK